jgi:hypothetical protein
MSDDGTVNLITALVKLGAPVVRPIIDKIVGKKRAKKGSAQKAPTAQLVRKPKERGGAERRVKERSESGKKMNRRLRNGLWFQYHMATRSGEFDEVVLDSHYKLMMADYLVAEASKYTFHDREQHLPVSASSALNSAIDHVWLLKSDAINPSTGLPAAVYLIEAIAERMIREYDVERIDRRKGGRRTLSASGS